MCSHATQYTGETVKHFTQSWRGVLRVWRCTAMIATYAFQIRGVIMVSFRSHKTWIMVRIRFELTYSWLLYVPLTFMFSKNFCPVVVGGGWITIDICIVIKSVFLELFRSVPTKIYFLCLRRAPTTTTYDFPSRPQWMDLFARYMSSSFIRLLLISDNV